MGIQTLTVAGKRYVLLPEAEYRNLKGKIERSSAEDKQDAVLLRRRLAKMRRRGERPMPYSQARRELGFM